MAGHPSEQIRYCFEIYDLNSDGYISREEMLTMLKTCMIKTSNADEDGEEDGVKDLVDITMRRMDHDKDGRVSFPDFERTVQVQLSGNRDLVETFQFQSYLIQ